MASLFKRPTSKFWFACYRTRDGRQIRTTKFTDKPSALKMAVEWERVEGMAKSRLAAVAQFQNVKGGWERPHPCWRVFRRQGCQRSQAEQSTRGSTARRDSEQEDRFWAGNGHGEGMRWCHRAVYGWIGLGVVFLRGMGADAGYSPASFDDSDRLARIQAVLPRLDALYERHAVSYHIPGFVYGVVVDGQLIHSKAWGVARVESGTPVTTDTRFRIASMTKSFTALAILKLRDAGKLVLDDPLDRHVPAFRKVSLPTTDSPRITVRHVLKMTTGLPQDDPWGDRLLDQPLREFESLIARGFEFSNPPGVTWEYSNLGYGLLGEVIRRVSHRPYQEYITREILRPLGMTNTVWDYASIPRDALALGYRWEHERWQPEPLLRDGAFGAMGGLITTVGDFAKYQAFHLDAWPPRDGEEAGPVSRATRREMHRPAEMVSVQADPPAPGGSGNPNPRATGYSYGLGWNQDVRGVIWIRHGGGLPGYGSEHRFLPEYGVGLIA
ncbi:MAG: beta-lactamase family protein, partial [Verrucomicrobiae bacterium]|nr:beta-lactamase family protein [Verrucomicrobiae bacterium]